MRKIFNNNKTKKIITTILAVVMAVGLLFGIVSLFRNAEKKTKTISPSYAVGALTEDGKYKECTNALYTKDAFECQGLKITPAFESTVDYSVYFYDYDGQFVSAETDLNNMYHAEEMPLSVAYCRIVIHTDDEDIKFYEKHKFTNQLTVEVNKSQLTMAQRIAKGETYFDTDKYLVAYTNLGVGKFASGEFTAMEGSYSHWVQFNQPVTKDILVIAVETAVYEEEHEEEYFKFMSTNFSTANGSFCGPIVTLISDDTTYLYFDISTLQDVKYVATAPALVDDFTYYAIYAI